MLRELASRKADFGFAKDRISVSDFIPLGKLMDMLHNTYDASEYKTDMVGMHKGDFRLYTNNAALAECVRINFVKTVNF